MRSEIRSLPIYIDVLCLCAYCVSTFKIVFRSFVYANNTLVCELQDKKVIVTINIHELAF